MIRLTAAALSLLALAQPAWAGLDSGVAAYDAGEYTTAYRELFPLAMREDPVAAYLLSRMYLAGQGLDQNTEEGLKWLQLAAKRGEEAAQIQLGSRYEYGIGMAQSDAEAFRWYKKAAD